MNIIPTVIEKNSNKEYAYDLYSRLLTLQLSGLYSSSFSTLSILSAV